MTTGPLRPPSVRESGEALAPFAPAILAWPGHFDQPGEVSSAWERAIVTRPAGDRRTLDRALVFARERHAEQTRRGSTTPYWVHPVRVCLALMHWDATNRDLLVASLLHDLVEDTLTSPQEIRERFGARPAILVDWLTAPDGHLVDETRAYYRRLVEQGPSDARLLKLADRSDNLRSIQALVMRTGTRHRAWAGTYLERTRWQVLPLAADAPSIARVALVAAMADLAPLVAAGFTQP